MSAPVDVLEVMNGASLSLFEACRNADARALDKASAAVAELIEAVDKLFGADMERCMEMDGKEDQLEAVQLAKSALARVKGESA